jgi:L-2,4-diaminobutyric acid acetyltransferase
VSVIIRRAREEEFLDVYRFICSCGVLETYGEHFYRIVIRYFSSTCYVAERDGEIVGLMWGFITQEDSNTFFLWQIGVDPATRGEGIGGLILEEAEEDLAARGCKRIELTIDPTNYPSQRMFEKRGYRNISADHGKTIEVEGVVSIADYYRPDGHFCLYEKTLTPGD